VVDISDTGWERKLEATDEVLAELDLDAKPRLLVFNKTDLLSERTKLPAMVRSVYPDSVCVSGLAGAGLEELRDAIREEFSRGWESREVVLRYDQADVVRQLRQIVHVENVDYQGDRIAVHFRAPDPEFRRIQHRLQEGTAVQLAHSRRRPS
jgi:GTP-binding protein HflX